MGSRALRMPKTASRRFQEVQDVPKMFQRWLQNGLKRAQRRLENKTNREGRGEHCLLKLCLPGGRGVQKAARAWTKSFPKIGLLFVAAQVPRRRAAISKTRDTKEDQMKAKEESKESSEEQRRANESEGEPRKAEESRGEQRRAEKSRERQRRPEHHSRVSIYNR